jgi:protein HOOK3
VLHASFHSLSLSTFHRAPGYFDPTTIARHLGDNWALKSSNLRKLLRNLQQFYNHGLAKDADFDSHNASAIARSSDRAELAGLFELVAAAAVTCDKKAEFVGRIMTLAPDNQIQMKEIIQSSLRRLTDYADAGEEDEEEGNDENEMVFGAETPTAATMNVGVNAFRGGEDLEKALVDARRELATYKSQAGLLTEDHESAQKKLRALVEDLQDRLESRQDELATMEMEFKMASIELQDAQAKVADLEERNTALADDLDVANAKAEQLRKAEATVLSYRKKLENVGAMSEQMAALEDQSASYLRQIMELENEVKKIPAMQKTIDEQQSKLSAMENDQEDAGSAMKGSASQIAELKSKLTAAENSKKMYEEELRDLRAQQVASADDDLGAPMAALSLAGSAEFKEKIMRLEIENKNLVEKLEAHQKAEVASAAMASKSAIGSADVKRLEDEVSKLKEDLAKKEAEKAKISGDKDKLEAYTKRTLAKFQEKYLVALQECKAKLKEKQDKIEVLENRSTAEKTAQKREERLLSSTVYELGLAIMQNRLKER